MADGDHERVLVSNPKLVDLAPTWRRVRGWTVLHTASPDAKEGCRLYDLTSGSPDNLATLAVLHDWFRDVIETDDLRRAIAPLPLSTLHVTVCDGLSDLDRNKVTGRGSARLDRCLASLPGGVERPDEIALGHGQELCAVVDAASRPLRYAVTGVAHRGSAFVVELAVIADDRDAFDELCRHRTILQRSLSGALGTDIATRLRPHVTLGYAANAPLAARHGPHVTARSADVVADLAERVIEFRGAAVFAFDDMVSFTQGPGRGAGTTSVSRSETESRSIRRAIRGRLSSLRRRRPRR